ncbi:TOPRIM domain protein (plasmid) [Rippkaea orientalis PCC 8801]|uniref:TOPRIM domain protein n=1 Tax=Rippkaea orientalis (strain PCC 8801 / RF-1) TaxID=41431 RepID=B7K6Q2_RIPO1|nr:DUF3991 domain-containing protein [Rippkaea orientalis]ACK68474.1 TOPRIM domain protein [Rippkaea orientalis PCC 8801]
MLLKFFNRGTGKGKGPVEYILNATDTKGIPREPQPELLKGNPQQIITLIDSLDFKHKYTSGVISFAPTDAPTNEQLEAIITSFEDTAFAGLEPDQYDILWVKHTHTGGGATALAERGRVELHFVTPRVELTTGKSLNIAPPGANYYFEPWRDYWNMTHGWASPNDPQRARTYYPGYHALIDAQNCRLELNGQKPVSRDDARKLITNYLTAYIEEGQIQNRNDIVTTLEEAGFTITRQGDNYITVTHDDLHQRIRLKGGIYSASWRLGAEFTAETRTEPKTGGSDCGAEFTTISDKLAAYLQKRRDFHRQKYGAHYPSSPDLVEMDGLFPGGDFACDLSGYLGRQLGDESIFNESVQTDSNEPTNPQPTQAEDLGGGTLSKQGGQVHHSTPQQPLPNRLEMQREALSQAVDNDPLNRLETLFKTVDNDLLEREQTLSKTVDNLPLARLESLSNPLDNLSLPRQETLSNPLDNTPLSRQEILSNSLDNDRWGKQEQALLNAVNEDDESTRKRITRNLQELCRELRGGQERTTEINHQFPRTTEQKIGVFNHSTERINQELLRNNQLLQQHTDRLIRENQQARERLSRHHERLRRIKEQQFRELDKFKTDINLADYAQTLGYEVNKKKSSVNCLVLKDNQGDKILVGINQADGHYFYSSVNDDRDKGSIIDFIQKRRNLNLGEVRKELRPWLNNPYSPKEATPKLTPITQDRQKILTEFEGFQVIVTHPYLTQRGITPETSNLPRFQGIIYMDSRNNLIFPHQDREGVCGYEIRHQAFKGFSSGGTKGLWCSQGASTDTKLVICESPLDCLSYHQLFPDETTRYMATGGTLSEKQKDLLQGALTKINDLGGEIIVATDKDEAGQKMAQELRNLAPSTAQMSRVVPTHHKDWNEALMAEIRRQREQEQEQQQKRSRGRGLSR